jgi:hypothetical protein
MNAEVEIKQLLTEIRDNQRRALQLQQEQLDLARQQLERARSQVAESIALQKQAMARFKTVSRIAIPGVVACIVLIAYLVITYF